jgi:hypothetical protein
MRMQSRAPLIWQLRESDIKKAALDFEWLHWFLFFPFFSF